MENSRRPYDRSLSKDPLQKKPRLTEVTPATDRSSNGRSGFIQRPVASSFQKDRNSKSSDSVRVPLPHQPSPQHQELVSQYKTALAELTFNSKPIITNLTIIAGENMHAANAIAATVCANILEVPSDQKLPSLYLLDSIVKNIGRDYIKSFASRLPEVFCQAYRQVDPSIHQAMRHLFGTWKGVFPPQSLQMIEKELRFTTTIVNDSSDRATTSRTDSLSQHHAHSIHVNPKYLEARQHLHTTRERAAGSEISGSLMNPVEDVDIMERNSSVSSGRSWVHPYSKSIQHQPRNLENETARTTNSGIPYVDSEYSCSLSESPHLGTGRASETSKARVFDRSWYESSSNMTGKISNQKSDFDPNRGFESYVAHNSANSEAHVQHKLNLTSRTSDAVSRNWKNSGEEEYMWDEMNSRPADYNAAETLVKDRRISSFMSQRPLSPSFSADSSNQLPSNFSERSKTSTGPPTDPRKPPGLRNMGSHEQFSRDSLPLLSQDVNRASTQRMQPKYSMSTSAVVPIEQRRHVFSTNERNLEVSEFESSNEHSLFPSAISGSENRSTMMSPSSNKSKPHFADPPSPGQSIAGSLLAAVVQSGILDSSSLTGSLTKPSFEEGGKGSSLGDVPSLPSGLPQMPEAVDSTPNPVSSLLSALVAKGLISSSKSDSVPSTPPNLSDQPLDRMSLVESTSSTPVSSVPVVTVKLLSSIADEPSLPNSAVKISDDLPRSITNIKNLIGYEFRSDVVRNFHPDVVKDLSDLPHQCSMCGLRLKFMERLDRHMQWHALRVPAQDPSNMISRGWYADCVDWVAGIGQFHPRDPDADLLRSSGETLDCHEQKVPADESQCACILCGELFEDFYSIDRDEWMFKGAVCMTVPSSELHEGTVIIVHANCMSEDSVRDLGLACGPKLEKDA